MAERMLFMSGNDSKPYVEEVIQFEYYPGFSKSQKEKTINSLHKAIGNKYPNKKILEISSKSKNNIGAQLSAFNLKLYNEKLMLDLPVEVIFQASKEFEHGGPYIDLLKVSSRDAKKDERLKNSGKLINFIYDGEKIDINPKTLFYDYIYISALVQNWSMSKELLSYDIFTDIEFNHQKSINCQARSAAIFTYLIKKNKLKESLLSIGDFKNIYTDSEFTQLSMF